MRNPAKIIIGIIIFLALLSIPIWVTQASGNAEKVPDLTLPTKEAMEVVTGDPDYTGGCIEDTEYMRLHHMDLLYQWRAWAVRTDSDNDPGEVTWTDANGVKHVFSLDGTCLGCHTSREEFCNQCHDYTATQPGCWECHEELYNDSEGS
jgi:hypothetical protein